jgi:hypothetical protein
MMHGDPLKPLGWRFAPPLSERRSGNHGRTAPASAAAKQRGDAAFEQFRDRPNGEAN